MTRKVSIRRVAAESGVAVCTASRVFSGSAPVSEETGRAVLDPRHGLASRPAPGRCRRIAVMLNAQSYSSVYEQELSRSLLERIHGSGGLAMILTAQDMELLSLGWIDGVISCCYDVASERKLLESYDIPVVCVNNPTRSRDGIYAVNSDEEGAIRMVLELLVSHGHERIAFLALQPMTVYTHRYRRMLYETICRETYRMEPVVYEASRGEAILTLCRAVRDGVTAVMIPSELRNSRYFQPLESLGIRIPEDLSVVSWESPGISEYFHPPLTTVEQNFGELAAQSLELLEQVRCRHSPLVNRLVAYRLHARGTVAEPRRK